MDALLKLRSDSSAADRQLSTPCSPPKSGMAMGRIASKREIGVELEKLRAVFSPDAARWATMVPLYLDALGDLPADLLHEAVLRCIRHHQRFMPTPAEIRAQISSDLEHRRWMRDRDDSPWYPTVRLFRQDRLGDWGPVFRRMAEELSARLRPSG